MSALDATQNRLDARDLADILVYIHQFSKQVNFYDFSLEVSNWSVFFEKSAPFILARLAKSSVKGEKSLQGSEKSLRGSEATEGPLFTFQQYNALVKKDPTPANFQLLLDFTYRTTLLDVAALYADTKSVRGFQTVLEQELSSHEMTDAIRQFIGIANAAQHWLCGTKKDFYFLTEDPVWQLDITDIFAQNSLVSSEGGSSVIGTKGSQKQSILAWQRGLEQFYGYFSSVLNRLSEAAETHLNESLYPLETAFKERHEPHLGLLFAFLELFKHLKGQLNTLTAKHLDFYFRQVLKIQSRQAIPDAVHLVLETQKHVQQQLLTRGIEFRDGKDAKGQDILFSLDDEIIVNKAQITQLKTLFVKKNRSYTEGVFIAPVANSVDGKGMDFKDPMSKNWATLGNNKSKLVPKLGNESLEPTDNPLARLGFILASPVLFLQEGTRTITIDLTLANLPSDWHLSNIFLLNNQLPFKIYLSGEKEWINVKKYSLIADNELLTIIIALDATVAPIVHFNAENLKENYNTNQPLVKIEIDQNAKIVLNTEGVSPSNCCAERLISTDKIGVSAYHFLKDVQLMGAKITVQVCGIKKNIIVQNDENVQDVNGLIYPFGTRPNVPDFSVVNVVKPKRETLNLRFSERDGSNFFIGSKEIFLKKWTKVSINLNWKDKPADFNRYYGAYLQRTDTITQEEDNFSNFGLDEKDFQFNAAYLSEGDWHKEAANQPLFTKTAIADFEQQVVLVPPAKSVPSNKHDLTVPLTRLVPNTRNGFVKLTLRHQDFLHTNYAFVLARQMMAFGRFPEVVNGAVYMVANKPQVIDLKKLSEAIAKFRDASNNAPIKDVPKYIEDFMKKINDIIDRPTDPKIKDAFEEKYTLIKAIIDKQQNDQIVTDITGFATRIVEIKTIIDDKSMTGEAATQQKIDKIKAFFIQVKKQDEEDEKIIALLDAFFNKIKGFITDNSAGITADKKVTNIDNFFNNQKAHTALKDDVTAFFKKITDVIDDKTIVGESVSEQKFNKIVALFNGKDDIAIKGRINTFLDEFKGIKTIIDDRTINGEAPLVTKFKEIADIFDKDKLANIDHKDDKISVWEKVKTLADLAQAQADFFAGPDVQFDKNLAKALIPNEPWTPIIKNIALDYTAEADAEDITLIHLYPFETTFKAVDLAKITPLLPQIDDEGTLFMGFEQLKPSENVQILFQLAEATADTEGGRATVKWHYLSNKNAWKPLRTGFEILADATNGLTASGILKLAIPEDIGINNGSQNIDNQAITQMSSSQSWLKASVADNTRAVCEILGIFTQAVRATAKITEGSDTVRLDTPLPAESVGKLAVADAAIKQVVQPFDSFGGRMAETGNTFYLRVSEQLRHKGRAAMPFDYERLLLEAFPDIYKAKCIPHSLALPANDFQVDLPKAAGFVTLAVIPDLTRLKSGNLTEPRVALHLLDEITAFLKQKSSPFARLKVVNPRYEKVTIGFKLKLKKGKDATFYKQQLMAELRLFLAPWSVGDSDKLSFGQPIYYSDILTFIDQREYVDYVKCLTLDLEEQPRCPTTAAETAPSVKRAETNVLMLEKDALTFEKGILRPLTPRSVLIAGAIDIDILPNTCE